MIINKCIDLKRSNMSDTTPSQQELLRTWLDRCDESSDSGDSDDSLGSADSSSSTSSTSTTSSTDSSCSTVRLSPLVEELKEERLRDIATDSYPMKHIACIFSGNPCNPLKVVYGD
jgi:hypothetical protein